MDTTYTVEVMEIGDQIAALSPAKASDLLAYMKDRYNIEPIGLPSIEKPKEKPPEPKQQEQTEFSVILTNCDTNNKVGLVKLYREISGKGLKESMDAIVATSTGTPLIVKEGISKADADKLKLQLEACAGKVEIK